MKRIESDKSITNNSHFLLLLF